VAQHTGGAARATTAELGWWLSMLRSGDMSNRGGSGGRPGETYGAEDRKSYTVSGDLSPLPRASRVSSGYEAGGNAQEASEPSARLRSGEDGKGERERILEEVSSFQPAGTGG
jgi:hypothetical protein